ncbi:molecular chaperone HscC [Leeia aquatica]|uniref:Molecular chaperone HscC n=1 Tax=Leeia aquatica TaxID=2725557 RepID=A0A847RVG0_9NEIS|nr:molecular chaperone HscC [Leeia aquatica]NLR73811.1 molecular chaperone HscC [Leeia aquatica]
MIIGIDLGTTNSLVAIWRDGKAELIPNVLGEVLTPSVVALDEQDHILVGQAAKERLLFHPERTAAVFKRYMGTNHEVRLGKRSFRAEELSAFVLKALKEDAERYLGESVSEAIITVPAYFSDAQRKATRVAGEMAGLNVQRLLNEPTAASLAYGLHLGPVESKFLVFDLGGGTFDVSVLELFDGVMEVRASAGDNQLGGEDFVQILIEAFLKEAAKPLIDRIGTQPLLAQALRKEGERVKRLLTSQDEATFLLEWEGESYSWTVNEARFTVLAEPLLTRLRGPVERALRDARIRSAELDQVVLAGGSTRMPIVRKLVARLFGRLPAVHLNPDEIVARGAAVQAGLKMRDAALDEVVMTDVCPYTLGIAVSEELSHGRYQHGIFLPIIERNAVVPTSKEKTVSSMYDNQELLSVRIFQGESRLVQDNVFLGELDVPIPRRPAGEVSLDIRFTYDVDGLLEAQMKVPTTGEMHRLVVEKNPGLLTQEEINARLEALKDLKLHPREQLPNTVLLNRAERLFQQTLGNLRAAIGEWIRNFQAALETQDERIVAEARRDLKRLLDDVEGDSYL